MNNSTRIRSRATLLSLACLLTFGLPAGTSGAAQATLVPAPTDRCTQLVAAAQRSCKKEKASDYWQAKGACENVPAPAGRRTCILDAKDEHASVLEDCAAQFEARSGLCGDLGQSAYAPDVSPANFTTTIDNPFFPLVPGTVFLYESTEGEEVTVTVLADTAMIGGIEAVIVHDTGMVDGFLIEDTYDYYAQDLQGNVWYLGEDTVQYDEGRIIGVEGAWRTGVDGAKPGIVMEASPTAGDVYRQEFLLGEAEDHAEVIATDASATVPAGTYTGCVETADLSALEPDADENKFYASGVGQVLTIDNESGEREELVSITPP